MSRITEKLPTLDRYDFDDLENKYMFALAIGCRDPADQQRNRDELDEIREEIARRAKPKGET